MICLQKPIYRCEVWCLSTSIASLKLVHGLLPFFINYTGLSTRIKRFTLLRSPLGNKTSKDQFERREYRIYFCVESIKPSFILAYINALTYFNEVKYKVRISNTI
nr:ribosomal protein S10 [Silvetia siliquosa]